MKVPLLGLRASNQMPPFSLKQPLETAASAEASLTSLHWVRTNGKVFTARSVITPPDLCLGERLTAECNDRGNALFFSTFTERHGCWNLNGDSCRFEVSIARTHAADERYRADLL